MAVPKHIVNSLCENYVKSLEKPNYSELSRLYNINRVTLYKIIERNDLENKRLTFVKNKQIEQQTDTSMYDDYFRRRREAPIESSKLLEENKAYYKGLCKLLYNENQFTQENMMFLNKELLNILQMEKTLYGDYYDVVGVENENEDRDTSLEEELNKFKSKVQELKGKNID